jgi:predicted enzyme related to lactoylglutathione lyase
MVRKLGTVMIMVADIERSIAFYRDVLGLEVEQLSGEWAQADAGGTYIGLHGSERGGAGGEAPFALMFDVDDVEETFRAIATRGAETLEEPHEQPYGKIATVKDPDGYAVQLIEPSHR